MNIENFGSFYGNYFLYKLGEEEEAKSYLNSWKKCVLRKEKIKIIDEIWIFQPPFSYEQYHKMALKLLYKEDD